MTTPRMEHVSKEITVGSLRRLEMKWHSVTESQTKRIADDQSDKVLQQTTLLFDSLKMLGTHMRKGFETEGVRRKEDYKNRKRKWPPEWKNDSRKNNTLDSKSKVK